MLKNLRSKLNTCGTNIGFILVMMEAGAFIGIGKIIDSRDLYTFGENLFYNEYEILEIMKQMYSPALSREEWRVNKNCYDQITKLMNPSILF